MGAKRTTAAWCCGLLLLTGTALAEPPLEGDQGTGSQSDTQRAPGAVEVLFAASDADIKVLTEALDDPLRRLGTRMLTGRTGKVDFDTLIEPSTPARAVVAHVWIDMTEPGQVTLYIADGERSRFYARQLHLPQGLDEVAREHITYITRTSVETLLAGGQIGITREELRRRILPPARFQPPPTVSPAQQGPSPRAHWAWGAGVLYEATAYASQLPLSHGPGLGALMLRQHASPKPLIMATAALRLTEHVGHQDVVVRISTMALRVGLGSELKLTHGLAFRGLMGGGADLVHVTPERGEDASVALVAPFWAWDPLICLSVGTGLRRPGLQLWLAVGSDFATHPSRYLLERDRATDVVMNPRQVRPWARLEVWWVRD